jgi:uridine kinase
MRAALLISGYLRNYESGINFIKNQLSKQSFDVDVFLHITKNENREDRYFNLINENKDFEKVTSILNPTSVLTEANRKYSDDKLENATINQWSKLYRLNELKRVEEASSNFKYDLVIRYRPDVLLKEEIDFEEALNSGDGIYIPKDSKIDRVKLTNSSDQYLCDAFAYGTSTAMDTYFNIYEHLQDLISKTGPVSETLLYRYLADTSTSYKLLNLDYEIILSKCNVFGICGDSGSGKTTLANLLKKFFSNSFALECDRYHKWERGNQNWEKYTHLNPDANYIAKMNEDIFNLKLGNSIYQVDYDHKTGTFTESELIEPSENTIVCGLHSLYSKDDHLYNLKIFIDTDEQLKTQWKIRRDVHERGHTLEKVLDQISKRKDDYEKYIHPQRDNSDLVVRFFLDKEGNTQLQLSVHTTHDIGNILETLRRCEVVYEVGSQGDFTSITFLKYKDKSLWEDPTIPVYHNYYDYIIYFILNLGLEV